MRNRNDSYPLSDPEKVMFKKVSITENTAGPRQARRKSCLFLSVSFLAAMVPGPVRAQQGETVPLPSLQLVDAQGIDLRTVRRTKSDAQI